MKKRARLPRARIPARNSVRRFEQLESRLAMTAMNGEYSKPVLAADVTADRYVSPADALAIINYLNENGPGPTPATATTGPLYLVLNQACSLSLAV